MACPPPAGCVPPSVGPEPHSNSLMTSVQCCLVLSLSLPPTWEVLRAGTRSESSLCSQHWSWHIVGVQEKCVQRMKCTKLDRARPTQEYGRSLAVSSVGLGPTSQNSLTEAAGRRASQSHPGPVEGTEKQQARALLRAARAGTSVARPR